MNFPKLYIGPMSKNVVESVIKFSNERNIPIGLIPSRRQVEHDGGYVNGWTTREFVGFVRERSDSVFIQRDHGGPNQGDLPDDGRDSFLEDLDVGFDLIHVDPWRKYSDLNEAVEHTARLISMMMVRADSRVCFEVGTEEAIRPYSAEDLDEFLTRLKDRLVIGWNRIVYAVIQSGTGLQGTHNTGTFNPQKCLDMVAVCKKHGLLSKEHNGDYLSLQGIKQRFALGLDALNIAPEFGNAETKCYLKMGDESFQEEFYQLCLESGRWIKWFPEGFDPDQNKKLVVETAGHYVFSHPKFLELTSMLSNSDEEIQSHLQQKIEEIIAQTNPDSRVIAFDLDDTLCTRSSNEGRVDKYLTCKPIPEAIKLVNACHELGHEILIYTARGMSGFGGRKDDIIQSLYLLTRSQLDEWGVKYDKLIMGKAHYDLLVDDKVMNARDASLVSIISSL